MPLTPAQLVELQRLKEMFKPAGLQFNQRMQGIANMEKMAGKGVSLPTDKKAKGGSVMGINVASDRKADLSYADLIVDGHKTYESRNSDTLRPYVGKRVAIVRTGEGPAKAIGEVTIGEPEVVNKKRFREMEGHHLVPAGSQFDINTETKHLYPLHNAERYEQERDVGHGIISRKVIHEAKGGLAKFIAESKVKNRAYHGTQSDFKEFKSGPRNKLVKGMWFSQNPDDANYWAGKGQGANVMPVHLQLKNPASYEDYERMLKELPDEAKRTSAQRAAQLKKRGHDGLIVNSGTGNETYVALHNKQIKSAIGNRGTYDPNDPDITKAKGGKIEVRPTVFDDAASRRNPNIEAAARALAEGKMKQAAYAKVVAKEKPVKAYNFIPKPATDEQAMSVLIDRQKQNWKSHNNWPAGHRVGLRLDIPAYERHGVWVNSIHDESSGQEKKFPTSYGSVSSVRNATFEGSPHKAVRVATGEQTKTPFAKIKGELEHIDEDQAVKHFQKYMNHPDYRQVGYDPRRHGDFYDRETMQPITHSEHVVQIGPLVLAKKPVYGKPTLYAHGGPVHLAIGGQGPKNWIKGGVEQVTHPLKSSYGSPKEIAEAENLLQKMIGLNQPGLEGEIYRLRNELDRAKNPHAIAINQWIDRNLTNYIKKQMATHDDPIRKLAEQGIVHMPPEQMGYGSTQAEGVRKVHGAPRLGQSPEAQAWEDAADVAMHPMPIKDLHRDYREPWMVDADPQTKIFTNTDNMHAHYLGFDHLVDILKQDLNEGRLRPEQLSKVSIEHAVRRAHEYDQERKKAMGETALKATEGMPVHKEYPEGYKWIELALNPELPEGHKQTASGSYIDPEGNESIYHPNYAKLDDALKYEGDTMGHCVGGYTPDVVKGKSRIFSLRDAKNEPHVTIEVKPKNVDKAFGELPDEERFALAKEVKDKYFNGAMPGRSDEDKYYELLDQHYIAKHGEPAPAIKQIKGKQNTKPKKDYIPFVQDFVKSGNWSDVGDIKNAEMIKHKGQYLTHAEHDDWLMNQLKPDEKARGGIIHKAGGGNVQPSLTQMKMEIAKKANPINLKNIGVNEAPGMFPKTFFPPDQEYGGMPAPGGVATPSGMPVGGVDTSQQQPGQQLMPQPMAPPPPQGGLPGQPPAPGGAPGAPDMAPQGPTPPMGNMLQMTPQGQALGAMKPPQAMAKGGSAKSVDEMKAEIAAKAPTDTGKRVTINAEGSGGVKGIVVPRHTLEGNKKAGAVGMHEMNEARARVYGDDHREPLTLSKMASMHKKTLADHFAKSPEEQHEAEEAALNRLREAKHIGKTANTLDESEKLDTVRHEEDAQGRTHIGFASKGVAGHALYTTGKGKGTKYNVVNTCPGQTEGCGGGKDANGVVDTKKGTCFAPNAESQYAGAAVRRAAHAQAKHDPAMTNDWILAHTGSLRNAARLADKNNKRLLFRPNVVDETDVTSRHVIRHLNDQRKADKKPPIIANSYGKTNELHDPENGYYVTHSNVGPKVKKGESIAENIGRDKARVRNTIMAADNKGDFTNEQGNKTPPKGSYMVTDVKRGSPMAKKMEAHITHAKYWTTGREDHELTPEEKAEGPEGHFGGDGKPTKPEQAHYGHTTVGGKRFDYQKQHILHPRLVNVPERKKNKKTGQMETVDHMIPTDSRFKDEEFLPKNRFMTKNGKKAGHILMTTPTESTSNIGHQTSFTHNVSDKHIEHAIANKGEYEIDKPDDQIKAAGKEYRAPQSIKFYAEGGAVGGRHPGFEDDDFHAFPEQNVVAQRHLAMRHGEDETKHTRFKMPVAVHKNTGTMQLEMILKKKAK